MKLFLIDGHALIFKMYYAFLGRPMINAKGVDTSILYGFTKYLLELIRREQPTHIAVGFDPPGGTFRNQLYPEYKANRGETPQLVIDALEPLTQIVKALNIPVLMIPGFEADDVLGSMAKRSAREGFDVYMVTPDKDYGQLLEASDNVPGVKGVGEVGASKLLQKYDTLENIYEHLGELTPRQQELFRAAEDHIALSKVLVTIKTDIPIDTTANDMRLVAPSPSALDLFNIAYTYAYTNDKEELYAVNKREINRLMRTYVRGMMQQYPDSNFFPDANLTLRVAYGHVQGFSPKDAVYYTPYSTLEGIMEKENPEIYDYVVEPKLKQLYRDKDYGRYANVRGEMPVGFIATNHTTGGNSGSPVLNADGQLIGINFDRCWEGTMSDLLFDPNYCRNISLDIRYCLFIIDKFAGAKHLIDEMTIVD